MERKIFLAVVTLLILVFVGDWMVSMIPKPSVTPDDEAAFARFVHQVPALQPGDLVVMDDGTYVVVRPVRRPADRGRVLIKRLHPDARDEDPLVLHGGLSAQHLAIRDFRKTKHIVRQSDPGWAELQSRLVVGPPKK